MSGIVKNALPIIGGVGGFMLGGPAGAVAGTALGSSLSSSGQQISFPGQSPEEAALLSEQTRILRAQEDRLTESLRQQNLLQPLLFGQLGIEEVRDPATGQVTGYKRSGPQAEIDALLQDRQLKALKGDLPVDPRFEADRADARASFGELMQRNLGPGWETSTPGIDAMTAFDAETEGLRYGIRTGEMTTADALARGRQAQTFGGIFQSGQADLPFINTGTSVAGGFSGPLSNLLQNRGLQAQTNIANATNRSTQQGQILNLAGTAAGMLMYQDIFGKKK